MSSIRVLVVEDFAPFVQFIRSTLAEKPDLQVICEVAERPGSGSESGRTAAGSGPP